MTTNTERDGATQTVEYHEWLSTSPPYNNREIVIVNGKVLWEQAFVNGRRDLYDPTTDTIYLAPGVASNDVVGCKRCSGDTPQSNSVLSEVQDLLNKPQRDDQARRGAQRQACDRAHVRPRSLQLLDLAQQLSTAAGRGPSLPRHHALSDRARAHRTPGLTQMLSLRAQHPHASIDRSRADYRMANRVVDMRAAQTGR